jgi:uncharacterized integral membrane protein
MVNLLKVIVRGALPATLMTGFAKAQTSQLPMIGGQMTWPMVVGCLLLVVVLLLAAAAPIKHLVFRSALQRTITPARMRELTKT